MKNSYLDISFNEKNGSISSLVFAEDNSQMNWCSKGAGWGLIRSYNRRNDWDEVNRCAVPAAEGMKLQGFVQSESTAASVYSNGMLEVRVDRFFSENGRLCERYTVKNLREFDVFVGQDNFGVYVPLCDNYTYAEECLKYRCNTHIWCGGSTAYINALRMGESDINLGLVLTEGKLDSYSVEGSNSNVRGKFILNSSFFTLMKGEERVILEWEIFTHKGNEDFYKVISEYENTLKVTADYFTVHEDDMIEFSACGASVCRKTTISCNGESVAAEICGNRLTVKYKPTHPGEYRFEIKTGENVTYTEFCVVPGLSDLIKRRVDFIVENQQYRRENDPLDGAFLIYDTAEKHPVYDSAFGDHNACKERIGMALLITKYLQKNNDPKVRAALDRYVDFLFREFYDNDSGTVYGYDGKHNDRVRLYDAPWSTLLFAELYCLTGDPLYTERIAKTLTWYYTQGGEKFYPNGLSFGKIMTVLRESKNPDAEKIFDLIKVHAENIISNGIFYPRHEVNYEQTIVTPAVTHIAEMGALTGEKRYTEEAEKHIKNLERFNGHSPSFHLDEIPIRYWDDFWFGKAAVMGDTFPHYWSCLTARSYFAYYKISGDKKYLTAGRKCLRNCLCLFNEKGEGSCAYVYPYDLDGKRGQFYDEWANDQDFALYFTLELIDFL